MNGVSEDRAPSSLVVGWTGHRRLDDEGAIARAVEDVLRRVLAMATRDRVVGIGSVAAGADLIIAEALQSHGVPLIAMLPFARERFERDAPTETARRIDAVLDAARLVRIGASQESDELAYLETGLSMVEQVDVIIAVWNGKPSAGVGGTRDVIDCANDLFRPVIIIDAASGEATWPEPEVLAELERRQDAGRARESQAIQDGTDVIPVLRNHEQVVGAFNVLDEAAKAQSRFSRFVLLRIILLHLAAAAIAITAAVAFVDLKGPAWVIVPGVLKVGLLVWAFVLALASRRRHHGWIEARAGAELCRSFLAVWNMRRDVVTMPPAPTVSTAALRRELELAWLLNGRTVVDLGQARDEYLVGSQIPKDPNARGRLAGQQHYFSREQARASLLELRLARAAKWTTGVAILFGLMAMLIGFQVFMGREGGSGTEMREDHGALAWGLHIAKALSIVLPLATAAMLSFATAMDLTRRTARYREMSARLDDIRRRTAAARTWSSLGRAVADAEWMLQAELGEWYAFTRHAGQAH